MDGGHVHVIAPAVVLGAVTAECVSWGYIAWRRRKMHTTEERSHHTGYVVACRSCSRSETWCGSCEGDHRQDQPLC
jgi:hypothetical protein